MLLFCLRINVYFGPIMIRGEGCAGSGNMSSISRLKFVSRTASSSQFVRGSRLTFAILVYLSDCLNLIYRLFLKTFLNLLLSRPNFGPALPRDHKWWTRGFKSDFDQVRTKDTANQPLDTWNLILQFIFHDFSLLVSVEFCVLSLKLALNVERKHLTSMIVWYWVKW